MLGEKCALTESMDATKTGHKTAMKMDLNCLCVTFLTFKIRVLTLNRLEINIVHLHLSFGKTLFNPGSSTSVESLLFLCTDNRFA